ncbi:hypothetical protein HYC85_007439 [Camellia sinensis]|uniref:Pectate lyase superfamily protein domain-containing protein n=1 Tax=Camellia sinensis TaxID=4442 RepID=A0A7J7HNZ2_CAMSI|nr:hypothetical protein HYC85_007439 [Camellia sinensis]
MAFIQACNAACKSSTGPSNLVIPPGRFMVGKTIFKGPYSSNPVTVEIQETILANSNMSEFCGRACLLFQDVDGLTVLAGGIFDGQGQSTWLYSNYHSPDNCNSPLSISKFTSIKVQTVTNAVIWDINLVNSKGFHMTITSCSNFVVERLNITASENSLNPDEKHISRSDQVRVSNSIIRTGDCISIGESLSNDDSVRGIFVSNSSSTKTTNGVRIKTFHNSPQIQASNIIFEDITMNDVQNLIIIDQRNRSKDSIGVSSVKISDIHYRNKRGISISNVAITLNCSSTIPCEDIELADINIILSFNCLKKLLSFSSTCSLPIELSVPLETTKTPALTRAPNRWQPQKKNKNKNQGIATL